MQREPSQWLYSLSLDIDQSVANVCYYQDKLN